MVTEGDENSIDVFRKAFPYFIPVRYLEAAERNKTAAFSAEMLSAVHPYMGNWMLFCDFLESAKKVPVQEVSAEVATEGATDFFALIREEVTAPVAVAEAQPMDEHIPQPEPAIEWSAPPAEERVEVAAMMAEPHYEAPVQEITNTIETSNGAAEVPVHAPAMEQTAPEPEPVVAVSEAFLQMIREEGLESTKKSEEDKTAEALYVPPVAIVPQPVFEHHHEAPAKENTEPPVPTRQGQTAKSYEPAADQPSIIIRKEVTEILEPEEVADDHDDESPLIFPIL